MLRDFDVFERYGRIGVMVECVWVVALMMCFGVFATEFFQTMHIPLQVRAQVAEQKEGPDIAIQNLQDRMTFEEGKVTADEQTVARIVDNLDDIKVKQAQETIKIDSINRTLWTFLIPFILIVTKELSVFAIWFINKGKTR